MNLGIRLLGVAVLFAVNSPLAANANESKLDADGWTGVAQRDEIRPAFVFKKNGGLDRSGSLIVIASPFHMPTGDSSRTGWR